ncbi:MAG: NAD-specific glutamate dehydrogenase-domain-containing protein, partial [Olpidium bornovanus]
MRVDPPTRTISSTCDLSFFESLSTFSTGSMVLRKRSWQSSSNLALRIDLDGSLRGGGERPLGAFAGSAESTDGAGIHRKIFLTGQCTHVVDEPVVKILSAQVRVSSGGLHLEDALLDREQRNVERAAAQVENQDVFLLCRLLVEAVGDRGGRGLVDDAQDVQPGDLAGVLRSLALGVVEVGGHRDYRVGDLGAEERLRGLRHL